MSFTKTLSDLSNGDGSLGRTLGDSLQNSSMNTSYAHNSAPINKMRTRTPSRNVLTPSRSKGYDEVSKKTPNNKNSKLIQENEGDSRISTDIPRLQHALKKPSENINQTDEDKLYQKAITESLNTETDGRFLHYSVGRKDENRDLYKATSPVPKAVNKRLIPHMPEKVMDAPEIINDFYLNILDWSTSNILAIALGQDVYLWNAVTGDINCLMSAGYEEEHVTSLSWSPDAPSIIAVGLTAGRVQLWDASRKSLIRTMRLGGTSSAGRVPAVTWRDHLVTSGSSSGHIRHHDTRVAHHEVGVNEFHTQEVCGLAWSPDKKFLASGANDNLVCVWSGNDLSTTKPTQILRDHIAAVKALAWCPWKPSLLCTGGGATDHKLCFWNSSTGVCIKSVDVSSQISGIIWNNEYREIMTSHGGPKNQLSIWKYPEIRKVTDLSEHQGRVLCITSSPNNEFVASCAADETLRIWHCFEVDKTTKKRVEAKTQNHSVYTRAIR